MNDPPRLPSLPDDLWLTTSDAAKLIGCSTGGVAKHVLRGRLRVDARGYRGRLMFRYATVKRFVTDRAAASGGTAS